MTVALFLRKASANETSSRLRSFFHAAIFLRRESALAVSPLVTMASCTSSTLVHGSDCVAAASRVATIHSSSCLVKGASVSTESSTSSMSSWSGVTSGVAWRRRTRSALASASAFTLAARRRRTISQPTPRREVCHDISVLGMLQHPTRPVLLNCVAALRSTATLAVPGRPRLLVSPTQPDSLER